MRASYPPPSTALPRTNARHVGGARLETRWWAFAAFFAWSIASAGAVLSRIWGPSESLSWSLGTSLLAAGILAFVWRHRDENRRTVDSPRLERFGPGNVVTLTRGLILAMAGGFLFSPAPDLPVLWLPATLYTAAIVADLFDGVLARRANFSTLLGARLDIELDGLGVLLAFSLAVHLGQLPAWFIPIGFLRPLFAAGLWWRRREGLVVHDLPSSRHRKLLAGVQMGFLSAALWPVLAPDTLTLLGVCLLTPTVVGFARDWLVVTGRLPTSGVSYARLHRWTGDAVTRLLPLALRLIAAVAALWLSFGDPLSGAPAAKTAIIVGLASISAGFLGRANAIMLIIVVGIRAAATSLDPLTSLILAGAAAALVFGTGPASLWRPEEPYVLTKVEVEG